MSCGYGFVWPFFAYRLSSVRSRLSVWSSVISCRGCFCFDRGFIRDDGDDDGASGVNLINSQPSIIISYLRTELKSHFLNKFFSVKIIYFVWAPVSGISNRWCHWYSSAIPSLQVVWWRKCKSLQVCSSLCTYGCHSTCFFLCLSVSYCIIVSIYISLYLIALIFVFLSVIASIIQFFYIWLSVTLYCSMLLCITKCCYVLLCLHFFPSVSEWMKLSGH